MQQPPLMRLSMSKDYVRPVKTTTDRMQNKEEIKKALTEFIEVPIEDVNFLPNGQLLRYISYDKQKRRELFRFGGILKKVEREYMILQGKNGMSFSVQRYTKDENGNILHTTRFFKRLPKEEIVREEYEDAIEQSEEVIQRQNDVIEKQKRELLALKKRMEELERNTMSSRQTSRDRSPSSDRRRK